MTTEDRGKLVHYLNMWCYTSDCEICPFYNTEENECSNNYENWNVFSDEDLVNAYNKVRNHLQKLEDTKTGRMVLAFQYFCQAMVSCDNCPFNYKEEDFLKAIQDDNIDEDNLVICDNVVDKTNALMLKPELYEQNKEFFDTMLNKMSEYANKPNSFVEDMVDTED